MTTDPLAPLASLIDGYQTTAVLRAAVELDLPDLLAASPADAATLAARSGADAAALQRLLGVLTALGLTSAAGDGRFALTESGQALTSASTSGMRQRLLLATTHYAPVWERIADNVRSGITAFGQLHGCTPWQYRQQHTESGQLFNDWLRFETGRVARLLAAALELPAQVHVADIGGGTGALLMALLDAHPQLQATLFDQPHVVAQAEAQWRAAGHPRHPASVAGDFMLDIPVSADVYLLKSILHDWNDADSLRILSRCHHAMPSGARLLLIERMLPEDPPEDASTHLLDLHMMLVTGGRERRFGQFRALLEQAGFRYNGVRSTPSAFTVIEAVRP